MKEVTKNSCNLCAPLGAVLAFKGLEGSVSLLHGSQGCATYIRRYLISHFREPIDTASSSFTEQTAVFGGGENLKQAILNVNRQYTPRYIGIASTCLSETIGDDLNMIVREFRKEHEGDAGQLPRLISASTPSYSGNHAVGFYTTVRETVKALAEKKPRGSHLNLFAHMLSPADLRYLKRLMEKMHLDYVLFPDYEKTLDGGSWGEYQAVPEGGTPGEEVARTGSAAASIEFLSPGSEKRSTSGYLQSAFDVPMLLTQIPIGVTLTDRFFEHLCSAGSSALPQEEEEARSRLIDAYTDGHKYLFGRKVLIYGDEEMVISLYSFCSEIGMIPVICATGGEEELLREGIGSVRRYQEESLLPYPLIAGDADFEELHDLAKEHEVSFMLGNGKGYKVARRLQVPLVRLSFPVHDRFGAARIRTIGYEGTLELYDTIVNKVLEERQATHPVGYTYM